MKARSHAFLEAVDRSDAPAVRTDLASAFTRFEHGRLKDGAQVVRELEAVDPGGAVSRTWGEEHVSIGPSTATFIGEATERFPRRNGEPPLSLSFWNTLVWVRDDAGAWKVTHWGCEEAPSARDEWNETYRRGLGFRAEPNEVLVDAVAGRTPGAALDVAMGQGRNALHLASRGWKVTGVDISDEGIRIAKESAAQRGLALDAVRADLDTWDYGVDRWDLVTYVYAGADPRAVEKMAASLRRGGLLVIEVFHADGRGGTRSSGFATGQLRALVGDAFTVLRDDVVEDTPDWGGPAKVKLVRFVAEKKD